MGTSASNSLVPSAPTFVLRKEKLIGPPDVRNFCTPTDRSTPVVACQLPLRWKVTYPGIRERKALGSSLRQRLKERAWVLTARAPISLEAPRMIFCPPILRLERILMPRCLFPITSLRLEEVSMQ